ncbi:hypothetical protein OMR58_25725 [Erwinia sp. INIA-01]|uniref:hypothetical protein n=1 Tax=Erwinia sp. INIA01 TaxID=2991500 RepID=UPI002225782C|nr:hypothetical protein [Erwinia sp. INIA01]MCW1877840.1 hypothetical protein [Erwinia sp. INIA01]
MAETHLNLTRAAAAAGITRRTLYNHINQGKVTASRDKKNNPVVDVSELIRVYGNVSLPVKKIPAISQRENSHQNFSHEQIESLQREMKELRQTVTLMIEDRQAREEERRDHEKQNQALQGEINRLKSELDQEKKKGFWSRLFG